MEKDSIPSRKRRPPSYYIRLQRRKNERAKAKAEAHDEDEQDHGGAEQAHNEAGQAHGRAGQAHDEAGQPYGGTIKNQIFTKMIEVEIKTYITLEDPIKDFQHFQFSRIIENDIADIIDNYDLELKSVELLGLIEKDIGPPNYYVYTLLVKIKSQSSKQSVSEIFQRKFHRLRKHHDMKEYETSLRFTFIDRTKGYCYLKISEWTSNKMD